jgi:hypothetical protein
MHDQELRTHVVRLLTWQDAHVSYDAAVTGFPERLRGVAPPGVPHSAWQLVEHLRLAQEDILDFCRNPAYRERRFPDDYWPALPAPPAADAWDRSVSEYVSDRAALVALAGDLGVDLFARIPHGDGQTWLRELLLVADHGAYHVGQLVLVRRLLGCWPPA